jgi:hypothetical protein
MKLDKEWTCTIVAWMMFTKSYEDVPQDRLWCQPLFSVLVFFFETHYLSLLFNFGLNSFKRSFRSGVDALRHLLMTVPFETCQAQTAVC